MHGVRAHRARASAAVAAFATLAAIGQVVSAVPAAATGEVLAYGVNTGGVCVFDPPVVRQPGVGARADDACRLIALPPTASTGAAPPGTVNAPPGVLGSVVEKRTDTGDATATAGGGLPSVNLIGSTEKKDIVYFNAWARWSVFNDKKQLMYHDEIDFAVQYVRQDAMFVSDPPNQSYCGTGAGVFPHQPVVTDCWWQPGYLDGKMFSFRSGGTYRDLLLSVVPYDTRDIDMALAVMSDGSYDHFCTMASLPVNWSDSGCDAKTDWTP